MDWAYALPDPPAKATLLKRAWISFSRKHEADAKAWLTERPPIALMRGTYRRFIGDLAEADLPPTLAARVRSAGQAQSAPNRS